MTHIGRLPTRRAPASETSNSGAELWRLDVHPHWTGSQWSVSDPTVETRVGKFCAVYDVFSSIVCPIGEQGGSHRANVFCSV